MAWWYNDMARYGGSIDKYLDVFQTKNSTGSMAYDVQTDEKGMTLSMDLPGVKPADLKVESLAELVKIYGKQKGKDFAYEYPLNKIYNPKSGVAKLEDGVLTLSFSRHTKDKPTSYLIPVN
jgi:HSP20 family molecular chaperone IbpA